MELSAELGERTACAQVGLSRATFRRHHQRQPVAVASAQLLDEPLHREHLRYQARVVKRAQMREKRARRRSSLALTDEERTTVLSAIHQERFVDRSVPYIYATLLDEGVRYCSISTMYRLLHAIGEVGERRDQATRPARVKPELCATGPRQVFCWDITKLHGLQKWTYYYLYAIVDIYSRYVVGWMVADRESSELARMLLAETICKEGVDPSGLTIHADNGSSMASKPVAFLLADLGVTKSHSRPHVSNDNPHIESLFKTVKYQPEFPSTFANLAQARAFCRDFFSWYNRQHRHSSLALLTPADVHHGRAQAILRQRQVTLDAAYAAHPKRFVRGNPKAHGLPTASYINRPQDPANTPLDEMERSA